MKIRDVMTGPAVTVSPENLIVDAAKLMQTHNIGSIPVVDSEKLVGIVTDRDITVRSVARGLDPKKGEVRDVMTRDVTTVSPDESAENAARLMSYDRIRRLPVVENDRVVGIVALGDMATTDNMEFEAGSALCEISIGCQ